MSADLIPFPETVPKTSNEPVNWVAVVPTGPSQTDLDRLDDLLESLAYYEPNSGPVVIVNDGASPEYLLTLLARHRLKGVVLPSPRAGLGQAWMGRLTSGLAHAFIEINRRWPGRDILRMDTDALITQPFNALLARLTSEHPEAGMIGSVGLTPEGRRTGNWFRPRIYRMGKLFSRWDAPPHVRLNLFGSNATMRKMISAANRNGYEPDMAPCGGAYLLTAEAVRRLCTLPALHDIGVTADEALTEDVFFSIMVYAVGMKVVEQNSPGDVFGVCWKGLPATSLPELKERRHAIIHSVKDHESFKEPVTRAFFRAMRV